MNTYRFTVRVDAVIYVEADTVDEARDSLSGVYSNFGPLEVSNIRIEEEELIEDEE